ANGTTTPVPESLAGGFFDNTGGPEYVTVTASPASIGPIFPGDPSNPIAVSLAPMNQFQSQLNTIVSLTTLVGGPLGAPLSTSVSPASVDLVNGSSTATVSVAAPSSAGTGLHNVYLSARYDLTDSNTVVTSQLQQFLNFPVTVVDFSVSTPASIGFAANQTGAAAVTITSVNGFAGSVAVAQSIIMPATGLTQSIAPSSVTL